MDIAERYAFDLRRRLLSAERLSESAIARGLVFVKTPSSSVNASLSRVTRADHCFPARFGRFDFARFAMVLLLLPPESRQFSRCLLSLARTSHRVKFMASLSEG